MSTRGGEPRVEGPRRSAGDAGPGRERGRSRGRRGPCRPRRVRDRPEVLVEDDVGLLLGPERPVGDGENDDTGGAQRRAALRIEVVAVEHHGIEPQTRRQSRQAVGITRSLNVVESALADLFLDPGHAAHVTDQGDLRRLARGARRRGPGSGSRDPRRARPRRRSGGRHEDACAQCAVAPGAPRGRRHGRRRHTDTVNLSGGALRVADRLPRHRRPCCWFRHTTRRSKGEHSRRVVDPRHRWDRVLWQGVHPRGARQPQPQAGHHLQP